jgi:hypothetical protein
MKEIKKLIKVLRIRRKGIGIGIGKERGRGRIGII